MDQFVDDLAVDELQRTGPFVYHGHLHVERGKHRRVLDPNDATTHHRHRSWQFF